MSEIAILTSRPEVVRAVEQTLSAARLSRSVGGDTRLIIADEGDEPEQGGVACRIIVGDSSVEVLVGSERIEVKYDSFLSDPAAWVRLCQEAASARDRVREIEEELEFARHVEELMRSAEVEAVFEKVSRTALELAREDAATLLLHDPVVERYVVAFSNDGDHRDTGEFLPGVPVAALQAALESDEQFSVSLDGRGMAVVPIQVGTDLIGVLKIILSRHHTTPAIADAAEYIRAITPILFNLHQLSKNKDLALRDDLTKAFNRRFFDAHLDEELERARRYNAQLSIIFLDLDDLKLVNNLYGHLTGSRMLQEVAKRILGAVRTVDKVVRFGGDEFCIILPQTDPEQARAVANRVRRAMTERPFRLDATIDVPITASFGISSFPTHALSKDDLIRSADAAMYTVKSTTKNAIAVAVSETVPPPARNVTTHVE